MPELKTTDNFAETLAREIKNPVEIGSNEDAAVRRIALPAGWDLKQYDDSKTLPAPLRKIANVRLDMTDDFIAYMKRHGSLTDATIWCEADYPKGHVAFTGILNDHGDDPGKAAWRDHLASFVPEFSEEWRRWFGSNGKENAKSQFDFATFIEDNVKDITSPDGSGFPSGSAMLDMATKFEAAREMSYKSEIRTQSGGLSLTLIDTDDDRTVQQMQVFERFAIGIPVFRNADAYRIDARLRYRVNGPKLAFWYELIRPDKVLEAAATDIIKTIRDKTGHPFFFGDPFAR
jgi:uncharacterized protein YfdQ (DUF2303 family)